MSYSYDGLVQTWSHRFIRIALLAERYWSFWIDSAIDNEAVLYEGMELNRKEQSKRKHSHE
jgi:predicted chitinase